MALGWILAAIGLFLVGLLLYYTGAFPLQVLGGALGMVGLLLGLLVVAAIIALVARRGLAGRGGSRGGRLT